MKKAKKKRDREAEEVDAVVLGNGVKFYPLHYAKVIAARIISGLEPPNSVRVYKEYLKNK